MYMNLIEGGLLVAIFLMATLSAMGAGEKDHQKRKRMVEEEIDPGNLGSATGFGEGEVITEDHKPESEFKEEGEDKGVLNMIQVGVSKLNIKKNSDGLVEYIHDIPLSLIPHGTTGTIANHIRDLCQNGKAKMNRHLSFDLAAKIKQLRESGKAVEPGVEDTKDKKGKANINAA